MKRVTAWLAAVALLMSVAVSAQTTTGIEGGKDHPLVGRFDGSVMEYYQVKNFDRYFMLSLKGNTLDRYEVDGKITRIQYSSQKEHSVFEIYKSYERALKQAGFEILLVLDKTNCGVNLSEQLYIGEFNGLNALTDRAAIKPDFREGEFTYLSAKKKTGGGDVYAVVYVTRWKLPLITLDVIETGSLDEGLVSGKDLEQGLSEKGHVALRGIHFDTGKSEIKPESAGALKIIAEYLNGHRQKRFVIVGHTDSAGDFDANLKLSKERADAVRNELVRRYSVRTDQIITHGAGCTAPVASNATESGRAENRRVEIVEL